ncbi:hypothetical protein HMI49_02265 [Corallococcus exercitus]|uniref:Cytochrome c domain-containing protein n=1 Tax=Corallococcus exercitus TaxID=2316736 RepID=A0A7Y4KDV1_9BACT|nr:cytochrome c peroxidase [Corallococcus exercitus]NOK32028.1 hypothetical protein [Corallococcus exercitus]
MPDHPFSSPLFGRRFTLGVLMASLAGCTPSAESPPAQEKAAPAPAPVIAAPATAATAAKAEDVVMAETAAAATALALSTVGIEANTAGVEARSTATLPPGGYDFMRILPLRAEKVPAPKGLHIVNMPAAVQLGKALFWDVQLGSDSQTACATCHFRGGADDRTMNTVNPGIDGIFASGGVTAAGQLFTPSNVTNNDRIGSQGAVRSTFIGINPDLTQSTDMCQVVSAFPWYTERRVGARNSPTMIGAVYFRELFWDGLATHVFNGRDPFGHLGNGNGPYTIENVALASQAVAPPVDDVEMTCTGRPFNGPNSIGTKMLPRAALRLQHVAANDSVLGPLANPSGTGLICDGVPCTYQELVLRAMGPTLANNAEAEFSLIYGEALYAYQATLIPDRTPLDKFLEGNLTALTLKQLHGFGVFLGPARCNTCHNGGLLSDASWRAYQVAGSLNADGGDQGFHNLGLRPPNEDPGRGRVGAQGVPVSISGSPFDLGAFKTPSLRNIKLTAPYFHQGGKATLNDVIDFYAQGGRDVPNPQTTSLLQPFTLTTDQRAALIDFLTNALTDCRVEKERAPFDHPELPLPNRASGLPAVGATGTGSCP